VDNLATENTSLKTKADGLATEATQLRADQAKAQELFDKRQVKAESNALVEGEEPSAMPPDYPRLIVR
jgi:hypothetical protein